MKTQVLTLAVVSACGFLPQAFAHELAFSKTEQIHVVVDGEANTWCKPDVAITMQRPAWGDQKPLIGLLGKLPFILSQECPTAKYTWKAVDDKGAVYATGSGTANNLGLVTLSAATAQEVASAPPVATQPVAPAQPITVPTSAPAAVAAAPVSQETTAPTEPDVRSPAPAVPAAHALAEVKPTVAAPTEKVVAALVATPPAPAAAVAPLGSAPVGEATPAASPVAVVPPTTAPAPAEIVPQVGMTPPAPVQQAAIATSPTADFGRSVVAANTNLVGITDGSGCKWVISKTAIDEGDPSIAFTSTPAMPCGVSGFAEGKFDKLQWSIPNTYRGSAWSRPYVHPSGLMFNQSLSAAVQGRAVSFLSINADQALFQVGEIPARAMKVYLAYQRPNYRVLSPFGSDPYYVAITADESFALDPGELKRAAMEVFQLVKATSPTTVGQENVFFAKSLESLYAANNYSDDNGKILRSRMGENRGEFFFDAREGQNYTQRREEVRQRDARRQQQQMAELHTRVLTRYEQLKEGMKGLEGHEAEALAQMVGIKVKFSSPLQMNDPTSTTSAIPLMIHVTGKSGDFYEIDFPRNGRIQADVDMESKWYVVQAANMTPFLPLKNGRAVPTFRVYSVGVPEACAQDHCADRVSFGAVLSKEFPNAGIDFNWTPAISEQFVNAWKQASATIE